MLATISIISDDIIATSKLVHPAMNKLLYPMLSDEMTENVQKNSWSGINLQNDNMGGEGVFACMDLAKGTYVCHYGGRLLDLKMANEDIARGETKFLMEFSINSKPFFFNHYRYPNSLPSFGKMVNHSKRHANLKKKLFQDKHGDPVVMLVANRMIHKGEELTHDYGNKYGLNADCTANCKKCKADGKHHAVASDFMTFGVGDHFPKGVPCDSHPLLFVNSIFMVVWCFFQTVGVGVGAQIAMVVVVQPSGPSGPRRRWNVSILHQR